MQTLKSKIISSRGRDNGIQDLYVEAWVRQATQDYLLGTATTIEEGSFEISYDTGDLQTLRGNDASQAYFKIYQNHTLLTNTEGEPVSLGARSYPDIVIPAGRIISDPASIVKGIIATPKGRGIPNLIVRALNKATRGETMLSEGKTNAKGEYMILYGREVNQRGRAITGIDLVLKVYENRNGDNPVITSPLIIDALHEEVLNLSVGEEAYIGMDTYTTIHETLEDDLKDTALTNFSVRDVLILANTHELNVEDTSFYIQSGQWAEQWEGLPAEVYFGWFKTGLSTNWTEILNTIVEDLETALDTALAENYIPEAIAGQKRGLGQKIRQWRTDNLVMAKGERVERGSVGDLLSLSRVNREQQKTLLEKWQTHEGSPDEFWENMETDLGTDTYRDLELTLQLGTVTRNHLPLIESIKGKAKVNRIQDLAKLEAEDWLKLMEADNMEVPEDIPGEDAASRRKEFANQLRTITEEMLPTAVLARSFKEDSKVKSEVLDKFMDNNPDFEFRNTTVRAFLKENPNALESSGDKEAAQQELEAVQRVFHLTPTKEKSRGAKVLWQNQLHSAYAIKMEGLSNLRTLFNGDEELATRIYDKAKMRHDRAKMVKMQLHGVSEPVYALFPGRFDLLKEMDNAADLEALFGDQGFCKCKHCDSFFSPSAYLTDLFLYLNKVKVSLNGSNPDEDTALEKLFKRRPDLGNIQLDCDNSHTPLPYIDLVNEVLEMAIVPTAYKTESVKILGKSFTLPVAEVPQTESDSATLKAYPQHINQEAYSILSTGDEGKGIGFPWLLPFNLWMLEVRTFLEHLGISRAALMESILGGKIPAETIAAEYLGLLPEERAILTETTTNASSTKKYWGTTLAKLKEVPVLLQQTGYPYEKLTELLRMRYLNTDITVKFSPPSSCKVSDASVPDLTDAIVGRIHKFGRLLPKTNGDVNALDRTIIAFGGEINDAFFVDFSDMLRVENKIGKKLERKEVLSWWAPLDTTDYKDDPSLYTKLFKLPDTIPAFELNETKDELLNTGVTIDPMAPPLDPDLLALILSATRLTAKNLELIVSEEFPDGVITLNLSQLSYLFRIGSFCRTTKLKVSEYLALKHIFGFQPVSGIDKQVNPGQTLDFLQKHNTLKDLDLEPEMMDYVLRHQFRPNAPFILTDKEIENILRSLHEKLQLELNEVVPVGTTIRDRVNAKLEIVLGNTKPEDILTLKTIQGFLGGVTELSKSDQENLIDKQLLFLEDKKEARANLIEGGLANPEERFEYIHRALNHYLQKNTIILHLSEVLAIDPQIMSPMLQQYLTHPSNPDGKAISVFLEDSFITVNQQSETGEPKEWTTSEFPDLFSMLLRLHKIALLINGLAVELPELSFLMEKGAKAGTPDFNGLPVKEKPQMDEVEEWMTLFELILLNKEVFRGGSSAFGILDLAQTDTESNELLLNSLSEGSGWKREDLNYLVGPEGLNLSFPQGYISGNWLISIHQTLNLVNRVGATARQMASWTTPQITKTHADSVRNAAKAKYGEEQWQEVMVPLRNTIREVQRDALVQFVLHYRSRENEKKFVDIDDIYGHYLLDTQLAACADTSRIVLAASSVQLFVQRIMMNLEDDLSLPAGFMKEWKWRKYYRVWEANRKVFMWPENWIEPELRDDKTPIFRELENELLQGELTSEIVEKAYVNYLEKLHEVSRLTVCGMYRESTVFHVIAHTSGSPVMYYYRRWENRLQWTAWEKIDQDIFNGEELTGSSPGILLTPIVHNRRLFLFWPLFKIKKEPPTNKDEGLIEALKVEIDDLNSGIRELDRQIGKMSREIDILKEKAVKIEDLDEAVDFVDLSDYVKGIKGIIEDLEERINSALSSITTKKGKIRTKEEAIRKIEQGYLRYKISMAWSQYRDGTWTPKKVSGNELNTPLFIDDFKEGERISNYVVLPKIASDGNLVLYIIYTIGKHAYQLTSLFGFDDCKSEVRVLTPFLKTQAYKKLTDLSDSLSYMKSLGTIQPLSILSANGQKIELLKSGKLGSHTLKSFQDDIYKTTTPFYYEDNRYSFFISPPAPNNIRGKSTSFARSAALKSGTNTLQQAAFRLVDNRNGNEKDSGNSKILFANGSSGTTTSFFEQNQAHQVIVRVKENNNPSFSNRAKVTFGTGPAQNTNVLNHIRNKMVFDTNGYTFYPFYHPYTCLLLKQLNKYGIDGILDPDAKTVDGKELLHQATPSGKDMEDFKDTYKPNLAEVDWQKVKEEFDFDHGGVYSTYNWELFYHIPLYIATRLSQDQRFDEAQRWFHYIFDPTEAQGPIPYRFWKIKPFHTYTIDEMKKDMEAVMKGGSKIKKQIQAWEENPFNPHLLARFRRLAYMKAVVMKYLDNLIAWGDQLFRMDSMESLNEATQLYVLAGQILGKIPVETEAKPRIPKTFNELAAHLTEMGNAWVDLENIMIDEHEEEEEESTEQGRKTNRAGDLRSSPTRKLRTPRTKTIQQRATTSILDDIIYFCISPNEKLLGYWDTVADRLFKLRNCMNIEGLIRSVPLFQPPIDPALLVKAAAAGVDISSAINDLYAPMPYYRFQVLIQKAQETCQDLKSLGGTFLATLEKKDAEQLSLIRSQHEIELLEAIKDIRKAQIEEARLAEEALVASQELATIRLNNYSNRDYMNTAEYAAMTLSYTAIGFETVAGIIVTSAAMLAQAPDTKVAAHAQGMCSGTTAESELPGSGRKNETTAKDFSEFFKTLASLTRQTSGNIATLASYDRREEEWDLQKALAQQEIKQIDKQILGAAIRKDIATKEKENLDLQIRNVKLVDAYMRNKYTNQELYSWLVGQIASVYFQTYEMAYDMAKQAEKAFQFELGIESSNYIQFGYWDNMKKGLLAGEKLYHDLKRLDLAYLEKNKRDYEITKHFSLSLVNPMALLQLREKGTCEFEIPELLFDLDFPGQYFRRIKSVSISIPCIVGPYTSVSTRLSLLQNRIRKNGGSQADYAYTGLEDPNFRHNLVGLQSIATSSAQGDSGLFEFNFRDERYLPFEGAGAVSRWKLELPEEMRLFDYDTISDVILHMNYTARDGGDALKSKVNSHVTESLNKWLDEKSEEGEGLLRLLSLKQEFSSEWYRFFQPQQDEGEEPKHVLTLDIKPQHFPYFLRNRALSLMNITLAFKMKNEIDNEAVNGLPVLLLKVSEGSDTEIGTENVQIGGITTASLPMVSYDTDEELIGGWRIQINNNDLPDDLKTQTNDTSIGASIDSRKIEDIYLVFRYRV